MSTILPIAQRGEDILKLIAAPVADTEFSSTWLEELAKALKTTCWNEMESGLQHRKFIFLSV